MAILRRTTDEVFQKVRQRDLDMRQELLEEAKREELQEKTSNTRRKHKSSKSNGASTTNAAAAAAGGGGTGSTDIVHGTSHAKHQATTTFINPLLFHPIYNIVDVRTTKDEKWRKKKKKTKRRHHHH